MKVFTMEMKQTNTAGTENTATVTHADWCDQRQDSNNR